MNVIAILDTGCANLTSVQVAIKKILGYNPIITAEPHIIEKAEKIFLPGVGTAATVMNVLSKKKLINTIKQFKNPILGICLGMQILCSFSEEGNSTATLGIIKSSVVRLKNNNLSLPHIGWNQVRFQKPHFLFKNIPNYSRFYFVHSYVVPVDNYTISTTSYGCDFSSIIEKDNFFGVQFHPEKSGNIGSQLLKNFLEI